MPLRSATCHASRIGETHILADRGREYGVSRLAEPKLGIERREPRGRADIAPGAAVALAGQKPPGERAIKQGFQRKAARSAALEKSRVEQ